jgi:hypothetical protein
MPTYIIVGTGERSIWRLPGETNVEELRTNVGRCMTDGSYAQVTVEMQDDPRTTGTPRSTAQRCRSRCSWTRPSGR